jgi:ATP-binding cassette subfamily F protein 3
MSCSDQECRYGMTCVDFLRKHFPGSTEQEYRAHLGRYGLTGDLGLNEISTLSGGQKVRKFDSKNAF